MAGSGSGWVKSAGSVKGKVFISVDGLRSYYGADVDIAAKKAELRANPDAFVQDIAAIAARSDQPKGQAKEREPATQPVVSPPAPSRGVPTRSQADIDQMSAYMLVFLRRSIKSENDPVVRKVLDGLSDAELKAMVTKAMSTVIASADVSIRAPSGVLNQILDGGFLNQHATGTGGAMIDVQTRQHAEMNLLGIPKDSPPEDYPIYGYLSERGAPVAWDKTTDRYGDMRIVLKDSIRDRTSFTMGDSLNDAVGNMILAAPLGRPSMAAADNKRMYELISGLIKKKKLTQQLRIGKYWETQIHGPTGASDIARVDFSRANPPSPELTARLDSLGIPWTYQAN